MSLGLLKLYIEIPGCKSLKEKRSRLKPLLARLHREFNVSAAELDFNDSWNRALIGCAALSNDPNHTHQQLQQVAEWVEQNWPDVQVFDQQISL